MVGDEKTPRDNVVRAYLSRGEKITEKKKGEKYKLKNKPDTKGKTKETKDQSPKRDYKHALGSNFLRMAG